MHVSVECLSGDEIREAALIGDQPVDCVFGGAPCQGFSLIGHRVLDDPRNGLVRDFVRIVAELKARTFIFENVKGLTVGKHKTFLEELVVAFDEAGYAVRTPWKVLNAGNFGTPQSRERLIVMGARKGELLSGLSRTDDRYCWAQETPSGDCRMARLATMLLGTFPTLIDFSHFCARTRRRQPHSESLRLTQTEMRCTANDAWHFGYVREWNPSILTSSARDPAYRDIAPSASPRTASGTVEPISRFFKLPEHGVSNTLPRGH